MNFRPRPHDEPEINLIPFIDVLLVVLIFLMLSTTYSKFTQLQVKLPVANAEQLDNHPKEVTVSVSSDGRYMIDQTLVEDRSIAALSAALAEATRASKDPVIIINADASATHQSVISVMQAAHGLGLGQLTFKAQGIAQAGVK